MCSILHQCRHDLLLGSSWSRVQPVLRRGCHPDSLMERETRTLCHLPERYPSSVLTCFAQKLLVRFTAERMSRSCTTRTSTATIFRGSVRHFVEAYGISWDQHARSPTGDLVGEQRAGMSRATATVLLTIRKMMTSRPSRETVRRFDHSGGVF